MPHTPRVEGEAILCLRGCVVLLTTRAERVYHACMVNGDNMTRKRMQDKCIGSGTVIDDRYSAVTPDGKVHCQFCKRLVKRREHSWLERFQLPQHSFKQRL